MKNKNREDAKKNNAQNRKMRHENRARFSNGHNEHHGSSAAGIAHAKRFLALKLVRIVTYSKLLLRFDCMEREDDADLVLRKYEKEIVLERVQEIGEPAKLFTPVVFSEHTHDLAPSISPRELLSDIEDKKMYKEIRKFYESNTAMHKLILRMQKDILEAKPENILDFLADEWFAEKNHKRLRQMFY